jgi:hypothetical protein
MCRTYTVKLPCGRQHRDTHWHPPRVSHRRRCSCNMQCNPPHRRLLHKTHTLGSLLCEYPEDILYPQTPRTNSNHLEKRSQCVRDIRSAGNNIYFNKTLLKQRTNLLWQSVVPVKNMLLKWCNKTFSSSE